MSGHKKSAVSGTDRVLLDSIRIKVREENCNMFLLAIVTVFTVTIAASFCSVVPKDKAPVQFAERTSHAQPAAADKPVV